MSALNIAGTDRPQRHAGLCARRAARGPNLARIDPSHQRMRVFVGGYSVYGWPVSTPRHCYVTSNGPFRVEPMAPMWLSRKYYGSPMPHATFFRGGYAIHGTYATGAFGSRASHGCVRGAAAVVIRR